MDVPCLRFVRDAAVAGLLVALILTLQLLVQPAMSGFYCNDLSVNLPLRASTVSSGALLVVCLAVALIAITLSELANAPPAAAHMLFYKLVFVRLVSYLYTVLTDVFEICTHFR